MTTQEEKYGFLGHITSDDFLNVALMLKRGFNINTSIYTSSKLSPLLLACSGDCSMEMFAFLIDQGADVHYTDTKGSNAVFRSLEHGQIDKMELLLRLGVNPNCMIDNGSTPLTFTLSKENKTQEDVETIEILLRHGADPNLRGEKVNVVTPLSIAEYYGNKEVIELLIKHGVDPWLHYNWHAVQLIEQIETKYGIVFAEKVINNDHDTFIHRM